jgi:predicted amino acid racemase
MLRGGVSMLADSRLANLSRMKRAGIAAQMMLIRLPSPSEIDEVVALADHSLNSELEVIRALGERAAAVGRVHGVTLMVDVGERREGIMPDLVRDACRRIASFKGVRLEALGTNVACLSGVLPTMENVQVLVDLARDLGPELGFPIGVSGGNTATTILIETGEMPSGVTQLRIGEAILLGTDISNQRTVPGTRSDTFRLVAEVVEVQQKPSRPEGRQCVDAFGLKPAFVDRGVRLRAIAAVGKQDVEIGGLRPCDSGVLIIGASSDHLILDVTDAATPVRVGGTVEFWVDYPAMLRLMTSEYVAKCVCDRHTTWGGRSGNLFNHWSLE